MPRIVVLGCGTGVGKTRVSAALLRALTRANRPCVGLKPIESGVPQEPGVSSPAAGSDARALVASKIVSHAGLCRTRCTRLRTPVSPSLGGSLGNGHRNRVIPSRALGRGRRAEHDTACIVR